MRIYGATDKGLQRDTNQDYFEFYKFSDTSAFAVVCDGMGGANAGNVASKLATETIIRYLKSSYQPNLSFNATENLLRSAVLSANMAVYTEASKSAELKGMGTTVVLVLIKDSVAYVLHVGDSRVYQFKNGELLQLTVDHSMVQSLVDSGQITKEEALVHPKKNIITRALGVNSDVAIDLEVFDFDNDSVFLLCSDGLSNFVEASEIERELSKLDGSITERLIKDANNGGGGDNITAVVITK